MQIAAFRTRSAVEFADGTVRASYTNLFSNNMTPSCSTEHISSIDEAFAPREMWRTLVVDRTLPAGPKLDTRCTEKGWIF